MSTRILKPVKLLAVFCNTHCLQKKKKENSVLSGLAHRYLWLQSKCNRNIYLYEHLVCFRICPFSTDNTNGQGKLASSAPAVFGIHFVFQIFAHYGGQVSHMVSC